jgi:hypothetical protein
MLTLGCLGALGLGLGVDGIIISGYFSVDVRLSEAVVVVLVVRVVGTGSDDHKHELMDL